MMKSHTMTRGSLAMKVVFAAIVALAALACVVPAAQAEAKAMTLENAKGTIYVYPTLFDYSDGSCYCYYSLDSSSSTSNKPTKIKSSKESVCDVFAEPGSLSIECINFGTSTVSYKWKGKTHKVKIVVKWSNPAKSFKIGNKQYAGKYKKSSTEWASSKYLSGKVKVTAASGWKVSRIDGIRGDYSSKTIKNGKTTLKKSDKIQYVVVYFKNKNSGQEIYIELAGKGSYLLE